MENGHLSLTRCNVIRNKANSNGGGMMVNSVTLYISHSAMKYNIGIVGAGIWMFGINFYTENKRCFFLSNKASSLGGAIYYIGGCLNISSSNLNENLAITGAAIYINYSWIGHNTN